MAVLKPNNPNPSGGIRSLQLDVKTTEGCLRWLGRPANRSSLAVHFRTEAQKAHGMARFGDMARSRLGGAWGLHCPFFGAHTGQQDSQNQPDRFSGMCKTAGRWPHFSHVLCTEED